jgi:hypothetical protein
MGLASNGLLVLDGGRAHSLCLHRHRSHCLPKLHPLEAILHSLTGA